MLKNYKPKQKEWLGLESLQNKQEKATQLLLVV